MKYYQKALKIFPDDKACIDALRKCEREKEQYVKAKAKELPTKPLIERKENEQGDESPSLIEKLQGIISNLIENNGPAWRILSLTLAGGLCITLMYTYYDHRPRLYESTILQLKGEIETLQKQLDDSNAINEQLYQQIKTLKANPGNTTAIDDKQKEINKLTQEIAVLKKDNDKLKANQMDYTLINELNQKINSLRYENAELSKTITRHEKTIKDLLNK